MKHYFKDDAKPEILCIIYDEYDGEYNVRRVVLKNGRWHYASEDYRREYLADQPLSEADPEMWKDEISGEEFEAAWSEAMKGKQRRHYFKTPLKAGGVLYFEYDDGKAVRQVEMKHGQWRRCSEDLRHESLTHQLLSASDPEIWKHEISGEEFEEVWNAAIKAAWSEARKQSR